MKWLAAVISASTTRPEGSTSSRNHAGTGFRPNAVSSCTPFASAAEDAWVLGLVPHQYFAHVEPGEGALLPAAAAIVPASVPDDHGAEALRAQLQPVRRLDVDPGEDRAAARAQPLGEAVRAEGVHRPECPVEGRVSGRRKLRGKVERDGLRAMPDGQHPRAPVEHRGRDAQATAPARRRVGLTAADCDPQLAGRHRRLAPKRDDLDRPASPGGNADEEVAVMPAEREHRRIVGEGQLEPTCLGGRWRRDARRG